MFPSLKGITYTRFRVQTLYSVHLIMHLRVKNCNGLIDFGLYFNDMSTSNTYYYNGEKITLDMYLVLSLVFVEFGLDFLHGLLFQFLRKFFDGKP